MGRDFLQLGSTAGQGRLATVLSLERPSVGLLERFLSTRAAARFNHPFVGCTSLTNNVVCASVCAWGGSNHVMAIAGARRVFHLAQFTFLHLYAGGAEGMDGAGVWR